MNKKDICESLYQLRNTYHLDDAYLLKMQVVYDAAMVLRGIKSYCNDIDIRCIDEDTFEHVIHATKIKARPYKGTSLLYVPLDNNINVFGPWSSMIEPPVCRLVLLGPDMFSCWVVQTPVSLLVEKVRRNREKDQDDIKLIRDYLERLDQNQGVVVV